MMSRDDMLGMAIRGVAGIAIKGRREHADELQLTGTGE